jgi:hypothetical protein
MAPFAITKMQNELRFLSRGQQIKENVEYYSDINKEE